MFEVVRWQLTVGDKKLSYRTQYVEGIYNNSVTLQSRLVVSRHSLTHFIHSYSFNVEVDITQLQTDREARKEDRIILYM